mgnify:CR=1 FL=1
MPAFILEARNLVKKYGDLMSASIRRAATISSKASNGSTVSAV